MSGDIRLDARRRVVYRGNAPVRLSPREYDLFLLLARYDGAPVPKDMLMRVVWKDEVHPTSRTISQHVLELRRKLERNRAQPEIILTVNKFGYRLVGEWVGSESG